MLMDYVSSYTNDDELHFISQNTKELHFVSYQEIDLYLIFQIILIPLFCIGVRAHPDHYEATGVLHPDTRELGPHEKSVAATIELLPDIAEVFEQIASDPALDRKDAGSIMRLSTLAFLPITKKVLVKTAEAEGRKVNLDDIYSLNAAEAVAPSVVSFMERLGGTDFFKRRTTSYKTNPSHIQPAARSQPNYIPPVRNSYQP
ncbi:uncharacterized protein [Palaemon carinicauda]|uniref:uncharacterized protein n=1 Tax=Palaemon carinicauda TaxID=392227 RepID=UPI0035B607CD